ncbi:MAG: SMI1/KNR4 family protein [Planctomycetes bacterium]|nr:SMI1/KNR4 family protein [Planctomycetota bacterium]
MSHKTIATELGITLPSAYKVFWDEFSYECYTGNCESDFWHDAAAVVELTLDHRSGFGGNPPWPDNLVFIGDDGAACPYVLDINTEIVFHLDHGNIDKEHLGQDQTLTDWFDDYKMNFEDADLESVQLVNNKEWSVFKCTLMMSVLAMLPLSLLYNHPLYLLIGLGLTVCIYLLGILMFGKGHVIEGGISTFIMVILYVMLVPAMDSERESVEQKLPTEDVSIDRVAEFNPFENLKLIQAMSPSARYVLAMSDPNIKSLSKFYPVDPINIIESYYFPAILQGGTKFHATFDHENPTDVWEEYSDSFLYEVESPVDGWISDGKNMNNNKPLPKYHSNDGKKSGFGEGWKIGVMLADPYMKEGDFIWNHGKMNGLAINVEKKLVLYFAESW